MMKSTNTCLLHSVLATVFAGGLYIIVTFKRLGHGILHCISYQHCFLLSCTLFVYVSEGVGIT